MEKYKINGRIKIIQEQFDYTCPLEHKHIITVAYDFPLNTFTVDKEHHPSRDKQDEIRNEIIKFCDRYLCKFCDGKIGVKEKDLGGFENERGDPLDIKKPICSECWDMKNTTYLQFEQQDFISADSYLRIRNVIGNEELKDCPAFVGYPRTGKGNDAKIFSESDFKWIAEFKEKVDVEWERDPGPVKVLKATKKEIALKDKAQAECKHQWRLSGPKRQRCKICLKLKDNK